MSSPPVDPEILADLVAKYRGRLPEEVVEEVVHRVWADLDTPARFEAHLPVLVRRLADERLRDRVRSHLVGDRDDDEQVGRQT